MSNQIKSNQAYSLTGNLVTRHVRYIHFHQCLPGKHTVESQHNYFVLSVYNLYEFREFQ